MPNHISYILGSKARLEEQSNDLVVFKHYLLYIVYKGKYSSFQDRHFIQTPFANIEFYILC